MLPGRVRPKRGRSHGRRNIVSCTNVRYASRSNRAEYAGDGVGIGPHTPHPPGTRWSCTEEQGGTALRRRALRLALTIVLALLAAGVVRIYTHPPLVSFGMAERYDGQGRTVIYGVDREQRSVAAYADRGEGRRGGTHLSRGHGRGELLGRRACRQRSGEDGRGRAQVGDRTCQGVEDGTEAAAAGKPCTGAGLGRNAFPSRKGRRVLPLPRAPAQVYGSVATLNGDGTGQRVPRPSLM